MLIKKVFYINENLYKFSFYISIYDFKVNKNDNSSADLKLFNIFLLSFSVLLNISEAFFIIINLINSLN